MENTTIQLDPNLVILKDKWGWSARRIGREVGVSGVAVLGWFKGTTIREHHVKKLSEVVQANRYLLLPKITGYGPAVTRKETPNAGAYLRSLNVPIEDIARYSKLPIDKVKRLLSNHSEVTLETGRRLLEAYLTMEKIRPNDIVIDLLDQMPF